VRGRCRGAPVTPRHGAEGARLKIKSQYLARDPRRLGRPAWREFTAEKRKSHVGGIDGGEIRDLDEHQAAANPDRTLIAVQLPAIDEIRRAPL
jgi:hypothetical protein